MTIMDITKEKVKEVVGRIAVFVLLVNSSLQTFPLFLLITEDLSIA